MKTPKARRLSSGVFFIQLRLGGTSIPVVGETESEVTKRAELIKAEHRNGKKVAARRKIGEKTLEECLSDYIEANKAVLSPATIRGYNSVKKNRFPDYRDKRLNSIDWQKMINAELKAVSEKTVYNCWGLVRPALKHAGFPVL